jgi:hypothetical protein
MCLKEIGLHAHNMLFILVSTIDMIMGRGGDLYDHLMSMTIFTLIMHKIIIWASKIMKQMATGMI